MEAAAEHPAGGGVEGERKVEELVENPGRPGGREVQPGGVGLIFTDVGRRVPAEDDAGSEASEWGLRERRERDEERGGCGGAGAGEESPLLLPVPSFMESGDGGWGSGVGMYVTMLIPFARHARSAHFLSRLPWCVAFRFRSGLGGGQRGVCNVPPSRGQRTANGLYIISP